MYDCKSEVDTRLVFPKMSRVIMLNDDYTTQDFVVSILRDIFNKSSKEAINVMLEIHNNGSGVCGVYTYDIAYTKASIARQKSKQAGYPLRIIVEEA